MSKGLPKSRQTEQRIPLEKLLRVLTVLGDPAYRGKLTLAMIHKMQRRILHSQIQRQKAEAGGDGT